MEAFNKKRKCNTQQPKADAIHDAAAEASGHASARSSHKTRVLHLLEEVRALVPTETLDRATSLLAEIMTLWPRDDDDDDTDAHDERTTAAAAAAAPAAVLPALGLTSWRHPRGAAEAGCKPLSILALPIDLYATVCSFLYLHEHKLLAASCTLLRLRDALPRVWHTVAIGSSKISPEDPLAPPNFHLGLNAHDAPSAFDSLGGVLSNYRPPVIVDVFKETRHLSAPCIRGVVDPDTWLQELLDVSALCHFTALRSLSLGFEMGSLEPLSTCSLLERVDVMLDSGRRGSISLAPLASASALRELRLRDYDEDDPDLSRVIGDWSPLSQLVHLERLVVDGVGKIDMSILSPLVALRELQIEPRCSNVSPLSTLTALRTLGLVYSEVADVSPLSTLTALQELQLDGTQVTDVSPLSTLTALQELQLSDTQVTDFSPLSTLTALRELQLSDTQVTDVSPLSTLTALRELWLNRVTQVTDVTPLSTLTALRKLWLGYAQVSDVTSLSTLTALQEVWLNGTQVTDVSPLSVLTALQKLWLGGTAVTDVAPLSTLTALQELRLDGTQVIDVSPLSTLTALRELRLNGTQVIDVSPLSTLTALKRLCVPHETSTFSLSHLIRGGLRVSRL